MGLGIVIFHPPYRPNEFHRVKRNNGDADYYYVENGFFKLQNTIGGVLFSLLHVSVIGSFYVLLVHRPWNLYFISMIYFHIAAIGITVGSHRLWSHRAFEARWPLRLFLMLAQSSAGVFSIRTWFVQHVTHHKWSDTDADPHNIKRGLMFAHGFWLYKKRHPANFIKASTVDPSIIMTDPIVRFNHRYFDILFIVLGIVLPTVTGVYLTDSSWLHSFLVCYVLKHVMISQIAALLNSAAHVFGDKPYNPKIAATDDSILAKFSLGEGYHNYHHAFPQDYSTGEFGPCFLDLTFFIDFMAWIGQAYNLKTTSRRVIEQTRQNTIEKSQQRQTATTRNKSETRQKHLG